MSLDSVNPAAGVDYLSLSLPGSATASGYGEACSGATDSATCLTALEGLSDDIGFANACGLPAACRTSLVYTRGDEVGVVTDAAGLLEILGAIDGPTEAALVAFATQPPSGPSNAGYAPTEVSGAPSGFDVLTTYLESDCSPIVSRSALLHIEADGTVTSACDHVTSCAAGACI